MTEFTNYIEDIYIMRYKNDMEAYKKAEAANKKG